LGVSHRHEVAQERGIGPQDGQPSAIAHPRSAYWRLALSVLSVFSVFSE